MVNASLTAPLRISRSASLRRLQKGSPSRDIIEHDRFIDKVGSMDRRKCATDQRSLVLTVLLEGPICIIRLLPIVINNTLAINDIPRTEHQLRY